MSIPRINSNSDCYKTLECSQLGSNKVGLRENQPMRTSSRVRLDSLMHRHVQDTPYCILPSPYLPPSCLAPFRIFFLLFCTLSHILISLCAVDRTVVLILALSPSGVLSGPVETNKNPVSFPINLLPTATTTFSIAQPSYQFVPSKSASCHLHRHLLLRPHRHLYPFPVPVTVLYSPSIL